MKTLTAIDNQGIVCEDDAVSATSILVEAGRAIRKEYNS